METCASRAAMHELVTTNFGAIRYSESDIYHFPSGLPAFEAETRFLLLERPESAPVLFLQSLHTPDLAFITIPAAHIQPGYSVEPELADLDVLDAAGLAKCTLGALAILTISEGSVTANLQAPVLICAETHRGVQVLRPESPYASRHPLPLPGGGAPCS